MDDDPDAMWKPGFTAPTSDRDTSRSPLDDECGGGPGLPDRFHPAVSNREVVARTWTIERGGDGPVRPSRPWRRVGGAVLVVVVLMVAAGVVVSVLGDESAPHRPEPGELAGADEGRLPGEVEPLWSTILSGSGNALASVSVEGRDLVVAVADDGSRNRTMIVGVDATSGAMRWRRSFSFAPPEVSLVGFIDGVVLIEQSDLSDRRLIGLASVDGATVWQRDTEGGANTVLIGTDVVTHVSGAVGKMITFVDPMTGQPVGDVVGELLSTDLAGTWYVGQGSRVVSIDLSNGWSEPVTAEVERPASDIMAIVDGRLLTSDAAGQISELTRADPAGTELHGDDLPRVDSIFPAGGSSFVGLNNGEIFGAELDGDSVRTTWKRTASLRGFALTERGVVLSVSDAGIGFVDGVDLLVVDAVTGDRLAGAGAVDDLDALPLIVGDGFITLNEGVDGTERVGYDLNGVELWRLPVSGRVRVGEELVVVMTNTPAGYELTAYGSLG